MNIAVAAALALLCASMSFWYMLSLAPDEQRLSTVSIWATWAWSGVAATEISAEAQTVGPRFAAYIST